MSADVVSPVWAHGCYRTVELQNWNTQLLSLKWIAIVLLRTATKWHRRTNSIYMSSAIKSEELNMEQLDSDLHTT